MPNYLGKRAPNGTWREDTPRRREQKREAAKRFREGRREDKAYQERQNQLKRESAKRHANAAAERQSARKFRWIFRITATERTLVQLGWSEIGRGHFVRGRFVVVYADGRREREEMESPEALERRMGAMGAVNAAA